MDCPYESGFRVGYLAGRSGCVMSEAAPQIATVSTFARGYCDGFCAALLRQVVPDVSGLSFPRPGHTGQAPAGPFRVVVAPAGRRGLPVAVDAGA